MRKHLSRRASGTMISHDLPVFINKQHIKIPSQNSIHQTNCLNGPAVLNGRDWDRKK